MNEPIKAPWPVRLFNMFPILRRIPARLIGMGVRPEHDTDTGAPPNEAIGEIVMCVTAGSGPILSCAPLFQPRR